MTDRIKRKRPAEVKMDGRVASALSRRQSGAQTGKQDDARKVVVPYFGDKDDTPMLQLLKETPPVMQRHREGDRLHVSDVISKCVRRIVIMERMGVRHPSEKIADGRGITFAIGDALHDYITSRFVQGHPDKVYARWGCACGQTTEDGIYSRIREKSCANCGGSLTVHHEIPFAHSALPLTGSPDIVLYMDDYGAYYLIELKSMAGTQWKDLARPLPDHVVQLSFYWKILHDEGYPLVDKASIIYANKEFSFKLPYKEFMIDPQAEGVLDPYIEDIEAVVRARAGGAIPARTFCASPDSPEAKKCPVAVSCFGLRE